MLSKELCVNFKKTTTTTSCRTAPNNSVYEQDNETARAKYNLVGFSAVQVFLFFSFKFCRERSCATLIFSSEINNNGKTTTILQINRFTGLKLFLRDEYGVHEGNSLCKPGSPRGCRRVVFP